MLMASKIGKRVVLTLLLCLATVASVAQTNTTIFGATRVQLSFDFVSALGSLGVTPGTVFPTEARNGELPGRRRRD